MKTLDGAYTPPPDQAPQPSTTHEPTENRGLEMARDPVWVELLKDGGSNPVLCERLMGDYIQAHPERLSKARKLVNDLTRNFGLPLLVRDGDFLVRCMRRYLKDNTRCHTSWRNGRKDVLVENGEDAMFVLDTQKAIERQQIRHVDKTTWKEGFLTTFRKEVYYRHNFNTFGRDRIRFKVKDHEWSEGILYVARSSKPLQRLAIAPIRDLLRTSKHIFAPSFPDLDYLTFDLVFQFCTRGFYSIPTEWAVRFADKTPPLPEEEHFSDWPIDVTIQIHHDAYEAAVYFEDELLQLIAINKFRKPFSNLVEVEQLWRMVGYVYRPQTQGNNQRTLECIVTSHAVAGLDVFVERKVEEILWQWFKRRCDSSSTFAMRRRRPFSR
ncbi:hypothetical protein BCR34DRAFT_564211 [Clohesyomyces aquaticus]|uniref:Uncharacterized protein n=1 Tax=Clohesyomyces aquaticus TaxID=1231657 RepID=A0A1Y1ZPD9_9PLEO|nr:hypothetical protein BCR34DRAFT_564211 [Clohesyomyces aquaticus]